VMTMARVWVRTARLGKQRAPLYPGHRPPLNIVVELCEMDERDVPPGAGYPTRHAAKQAAKRKANARPTYVGE